eukprot:GSMAST32.ASY1.ANO1.2507.1 assembled CDS
MTDTGPLVVVSSYSSFKNLAHQPRGTEAEHSLRVFRLHPENGTLTLQTVMGKGITNPAFCRYSESRNMFYVCTELVEENGEVVALTIDPSTGRLSPFGNSVDAGGSSTCYLTLDPSEKWMLVCNYWDSLLTTLSVDESGALSSPIHIFDPKFGSTMNVKANSRVNHSKNDAASQANRQADPHSHALVLSPYRTSDSTGKICSRLMAYVPDLGRDLILQFSFDTTTGKLTPAGSIPSGPENDGPHGPRYIEFQSVKRMLQPAAFVVNELSSKSNVSLAQKLKPTLTLIQTISTVPVAFPRELNTCGRICLHASGKFILVSNRGHDSIAIFRVSTKPSLTLIGIKHTLGRTPRHFQLDESGQWLIVANQDSDSLSVFNFNVSTGNLTAIPNDRVYVLHFKISPTFFFH